MLSSDAIRTIAESVGISCAAIRGAATADHYLVRRAHGQSGMGELLGKDPRNWILARHDAARELIRLTPPALGTGTSRFQSIRDPESFLCSVERAHDRGQRVVIDDASRLSVKLARLETAFENMFGPGANLAITWAGPDKRELPPSRDNRPLLLLQLSGSEGWRLPAPQTPWPDPDQRLGTAFHGPVDEICLTPGDCLVVPAAMLHQASGGEDASIHLTIAFRPFAVSDALGAIIDYATNVDPQLRRAAHGTEALRDALEPGAGEAQARIYLAAQLLQRHCADPDFVSSALNWDRMRSLDEMTPLLGPATAGSEPEITCDTIVSVRDGAALWVVRRPGIVLLGYPGGNLKLPVNCGEAIRYVLNVALSSVGELPGALSDRSRIILVRQLLSLNILELAPARLSPEEAREAHFPESPAPRRDGSRRLRTAELSGAGPGGRGDARRHSGHR